MDQWIEILKKGHEPSRSSRDNRKCVHVRPEFFLSVRRTLVQSGLRWKPA